MFKWQIGAEMKIERTKNAAKNIVFGILLKIYSILFISFINLISSSIIKMDSNPLSYAVLIIE